MPQFSMFESLYRDHQFNFEILLTFIALHDYKMSCCLLGLGDELGHWVKPWLVTWFNHFLLTEYENNRWGDLFWMSKYTFMDICNQMRPLISKHDTRYKKASPIEICISCAMYKLAQGANTLTCSELFAIGWSFVAFVICKVVMAINLVCRKLITWPMGDKMQAVMFDLKTWCGMPNVIGAIDGTHISIAKPSNFYYKDYFFHKIMQYNVVAQVMFASQKRFMDVYVGLIGSVNDFGVLRKSRLYQCAIHRGLFDMAIGS